MNSLVFGQCEEGFSKNIFRKMDDSSLCIKLAPPMEVLFVATPVMREVGTDQQEVAALEISDVVANELRPRALFDVNKL
ncbi:hypothetical protein D3C87_1582430 [compost metagenome]